MEYKGPVPKGLTPFVKGDPRAKAAGRMNGVSQRSKLIKKLKTFDEKAWSTLGNLFESDDPHLALEALRIWAKYRLHCLTTDKSLETRESVPRMSPEFAKRILEALDS